jgi:hypothetical protein
MKLTSKRHYHNSNDPGNEKQSDSYYDVKCTTVYFHENSNNSQSNSWIRLKLYMKSLDLLLYLKVKFQVNQSSRRHRNTGQQRPYEFCYLLHFDLWASYLAKILFLQGCDSWFWEFPSLARIFNGQQHSFDMCNVESL